MLFVFERLCWVEDILQQVRLISCSSCVFLVGLFGAWNIISDVGMRNKEGHFSRVEVTYLWVSFQNDMRNTAFRHVILRWICFGKYSILACHLELNILCVRQHTGISPWDEYVCEILHSGILLSRFLHDLWETAYHHDIRFFQYLYLLEEENYYPKNFHRPRNFCMHTCVSHGACKLFFW